MNLDDLVARVGNLLGEDRTAAGSKLYTPEELEVGINASNRALWLDAVEESQAFFTKRKTVTVSGEYLDLTGRTVDAAGVHLVTRVEVDPGTGEFIPMEPTTVQDALEGLTGTPRQYYFEGDKMYLVPTPDKAVSLRIRYIPRCPALIGTQEALGGYLTDFHEAVAYDAAIPLAIKDQADPKGLIYRRDELKRQMGRYLVRRQRQQGRSIRFVGEY